MLRRKLDFMTCVRFVLFSNFALFIQEMQYYYLIAMKLPKVFASKICWIAHIPFKLIKVSLMVRENEALLRWSFFEMNAKKWITWGLYTILVTSISSWLYKMISEKRKCKENKHFRRKWKENIKCTRNHISSALASIARSLA